MEPEIWGPHAWQFLHSITLSYPDNPTFEDKNNHAFGYRCAGHREHRLRHPRGDDYRG